MAIESPGNFIYSSLDRLGLDDHLEKINRGISNFLARHGWSVHPPSFWLTPGARETLERLSACYPMAIVSARDQRGTLAFLNQFGLTDFFMAVAHSQTCSHTKPFPDPIQWAAKEMGVAPQDCLMIGDTSVDIRAGRAAGAQTVGVLSGFGYENELKHAGADLILPATIDLIEAIAFEGERITTNTSGMERQLR